ncbi:preprotein translocase subunit SecE [Polyangium mundeleinium]|uniref:Protein translocase subunit SecE n=1 Tax=Polyangium mundeleinium TaxID=2995306 RepID=A0ABT5EHD5_9BACT|nr:preprotein translocase subunit SecE [Polyangium mundeleinium]MDC0741227.1 preprotein translocase subunit SecE [Polyangium mundeleinium]
MATRREKDEARKAQKKGSAPESAPDSGADASLAVRKGSDLDVSPSADEAGEEHDDAAAEGPEGQAQDEGAGEDAEAAAARPLGSDRYVMAGFFGAAILGAYVLGKAIHGIWGNLSNRDWFSRAVPAVAAVADEDKATYATVIAGVVAVIVTLRTYRRPDVREWTDEVASELIKVKWPTKKDVTNSTMVVIAASAVATLYLALLDRLWSFVTGIVYGTGS